MTPTDSGGRFPRRVKVGETLEARLAVTAEAWRVVIADTIETPTSLIARGTRDGEAVVLKIVKLPGDEWHSGAVVRAFGEHGVVRALEHSAGALLLERLVPGHSLLELSLGGRDDEATEIIADVIGRMAPAPAPVGTPTVMDWGRAFDWYAGSGDRSIPRDVSSKAHAAYVELAESQRHTRLLHGDLQHYNILYDDHRGWLAIDPKGVIGDLEFELAAALRNPQGRPELFADRSVIQRRITRYSTLLDLDADRIMGWAFCGAVLSAIWAIQDGHSERAIEGALSLARALAPSGEVG